MEKSVKNNIEKLKNAVEGLDDLEQRIELIINYLDLLNYSIERKNKKDQANALYTSLMRNGGLRNIRENLGLINKKVSITSSALLNIHDDREEGA